MTEDDTYNALRKISFTQLLVNLKLMSWNTQWLISAQAAWLARPHHHWIADDLKRYNWTIEEFIEAREKFQIKNPV